MALWNRAQHLGDPLCGGALRRSPARRMRARYRPWARGHGAVLDFRVADGAWYSMLCSLPPPLLQDSFDRLRASWRSASEQMSPENLFRAIPMVHPKGHIIPGLPLGLIGRFPDIVYRSEPSAHGMLQQYTIHPDIVAKLEALNLKQKSPSRHWTWDHLRDGYRGMHIASPEDPPTLDAADLIRLWGYAKHIVDHVQSSAL